MSQAFLCQLTGATAHNKRQAPILLAACRSVASTHLQSDYLIEPKTKLARSIPALSDLGSIFGLTSMTPEGKA